jgi:hypothetical protein
MVMEPGTGHTSQQRTMRGMVPPLNDDSMKRKAPQPAEQALAAIMKGLLLGINRKGFAVLVSFGLETVRGYCHLREVSRRERGESE